MKFARFDHEGSVNFGLVDETRGKVAVIRGVPTTGFEETDIHHPLSDVKILPPTTPTKIVCVGMNYREHIKEIGGKVPEKPHFFLKPPSSLIGHEDAIVIPEGAARVDYEGELAVIVKDRMKAVPEDQTMRHVLGYSCFNDVTERSLVSKDPLLLAMAKGFDTFSCLGPYLTTELDPNQLNLKTYLNGQLMQQDNTRNCVFTVEQILHHVSMCMTLYPGDVVTTGTPRGIAPMKAGDVVEVEIEGVGTLRNRVIEA